MYIDSFQPGASQLHIDNQFCLDFIRLDLYTHEGPLSLTLNEYRILMGLLHSPERIKSRAYLLDIIAPDHKISVRNIDVHIRSLRQKLSTRSWQVETIRGLGYRWTGPVPSSTYQNYSH